MAIIESKLPCADVFFGLINSAELKYVEFPVTGNTDMNTGETGSSGFLKTVTDNCCRPAKTEMEKPNTGMNHK